MDEHKSGLYIVAIVGVIAVVALVVLVMGVSTSRSVSVTDSGSYNLDDNAGQMIQALDSSMDGGSTSSSSTYRAPEASVTMYTIDYAVKSDRIFPTEGFSLYVCKSTDSKSTDKDSIGYDYKVVGTAYMECNGNSNCNAGRYTDTCVTANTKVNSCKGSTCYLQEYGCFRPYTKSTLGNRYALDYHQIQCANCNNGACSQ